MFEKGFKFVFTYVHDQVPDQDNSSSNCSIYVPEPKAEEYGIVRFITKLSAKQENKVPKPRIDLVKHYILADIFIS